MKSPPHEETWGSCLTLGTEQVLMNCSHSLTNARADIEHMLSEVDGDTEVTSQAEP